MKLFGRELFLVSARRLGEVVKKDRQTTAPEVSTDRRGGLFPELPKITFTRRKSPRPSQLPPVGPRAEIPLPGAFRPPAPTTFSPPPMPLWNEAPALSPSLAPKQVHPAAVQVAASIPSSEARDGTLSLAAAALLPSAHDASVGRAASLPLADPRRDLTGRSVAAAMGPGEHAIDLQAALAADLSAPLPRPGPDGTSS